MQHKTYICCLGVFVYFGDADRSSWSCPVRFDKVPLVSWQQVILHCFYEKIFTGVVVLYQSFFLHDLKQRAHVRETGLTLSHAGDERSHLHALSEPHSCTPTDTCSRSEASFLVFISCVSEQKD